MGFASAFTFTAGLQLAVFEIRFPENPAVTSRAIPYSGCAVGIYAAPFAVRAFPLILNRR